MDLVHFRGFVFFSNYAYRKVYKDDLYTRHVVTFYFDGTRIFALEYSYFHLTKDCFIVCLNNFLRNDLVYVCFLRIIYQRVHVT